MPLFRFPGVRSVITYSLVGAVVYAGIMQVPDNENIETVRKLMEYAVVFFFGTKTGTATAENARAARRTTGEAE